MQAIPGFMRYSPEIESRIVKGFTKKGWGLYHHPRGPDGQLVEEATFIHGPATCLFPNQAYRLFPIADNPASKESIIQKIQSLGFPPYLTVPTPTLVFQETPGTTIIGEDGKEHPDVSPIHLQPDRVLEVQGIIPQNRYIQVISQWKVNMRYQDLLPLLESPETGLVSTLNPPTKAQLAQLKFHIPG